MHKRLSTLAAVIILLSGCQSTPEKKIESETLSAAHLSTEWQLVKLQDHQMESTPPITMNLNLEQQPGKVQGFNGCNLYFGGATFDSSKKTIAFTQLAGTMRACPIVQMELEQRFMRALDNQTMSLQLSNGHLILHKATTILEFKPTPKTIH